MTERQRRLKGTSSDNGLTIRVKPGPETFDPLPEGTPVTDATGFSRYLRRIVAELASPRRGEHGWDNDDLPSFLEALSAVFIDHQGVILPSGRRKGITYKNLVDMFEAAKIYE